MTDASGAIFEAVLALALLLVTIPLHEYGHKFAYRVLGYNANIIWRDRANEHWWSIGASCGVPHFWGTSLDHVFVDGAGGAVQAVAFVIPMLFFESFGFFTITCIFCLVYMFYEIIKGNPMTGLIFRRLGGEMLKTVLYGKNNDRLLKILMILLVPAFILSFYLIGTFIVPLLPLDWDIAAFMVCLALLPPTIVIVSLYGVMAMEVISRS